MWLQSLLYAYICVSSVCLEIKHGMYEGDVGLLSKHEAGL